MALFFCALQNNASAQYIVKNTAYTNQSWSGGGYLHKKIGSFVIQNASSTDTFWISSIETGLVADSFKVIFSNLMIYRYPANIGVTIGDTPIANVTLADFFIEPGSMTQLEIYADLSPIITPAGFTMTLKFNSMRGYGFVRTAYTSNITNGQTITVH